jgi:hypothetical protein
MTNIILRGGIMAAGLQLSAAGITYGFANKKESDCGAS